MLVSIIMPVRDALESVQTCLGSLLRYTDMSKVELIIIDDGSKEPTEKYLKQFHDENTCYDIKVIRCPIAHGWCKAINSGVQVAKGDYIVFSNSDIGFTHLWLEYLLSHFVNNMELGLLGPITNSAAGSQQVSNEDYIKYSGEKLTYTDYLMFFLTMLRRDVWEKVGALDERFGLGGQDDADYCRRAINAGYKIGIAHDCYVKHFGSASFKELFNNDVPMSQEYAQSRQKILAEKYGILDNAIKERPQLFQQINKQNNFPLLNELNPDIANQKIKRPRIFLSIPNNWKISSELAMVVMRWLMSGKYDIYITMPMGLVPLDNARNASVKEFRELDYDYLFWIDDDIIPPVDALDRLLAADKDIVGAVAFAMRNDNGQYFPYPVTLRYNEDRQFVLYFGKGVDRVDALGGACVLVKRKVYETIERPYEFSYHADGTMALDCDFRFYQKAADHGFEIYVDFNLLCDHQRTASIKGMQDCVARVKMEGDKWKEKAENLQRQIDILHQKIGMNNI